MKLPTLAVVTKIQAPIGTCFDLARDIGFHVRTMSHTNERAVGGRTDGPIELNETVTREARHLGMTRRMTVKIASMDRPRSLRDAQVDGPFRHLIHEPQFETLDNGLTRMTDVIDFQSPYGWVGRAVDRCYLARYQRHFIQARADALKSEAESR